MNMTGYWAKIGIKALVIFGVGFFLINVFRDGRSHVVRAVETNSDLTIPLPFLPFSFDGTRLGTFRKIVLHRSTPDRVESVDLTVRVNDAATLSRFENCRVTVEDPTHLDENSSFSCVADGAGMTEFGKLRIYARGEGGGWRLSSTVPLMLPEELTHRIRGRDAQNHASELERDRFQAIGDSIQALAREFATASEAVERDRLRSRMEELESEMSDLRRAIIEAAREQAEAAVATATEVNVELATPEVPAAPRVKVVVSPPKPPR